LQRRINMVMETAKKLSKVDEAKDAIGHWERT
jgi:hypothetical protein